MDSNDVSSKFFDLASGVDFVHGTWVPPAENTGCSRWKMGRETHTNGDFLRRKSHAQEAPSHQPPTQLPGQGVLLGSGQSTQMVRKAQEAGQDLDGR